MNTAELLLLPERRLQHIVRLLLSDTDIIRRTTTGKPLQIVSAGEWNAGAGPDFRNMAVLADGTVTIGDGEFHRRSAEWTAHGHNSDPAYDNLLLHIVLEDNAGQAFARHTLVISPDELTALLHIVPDANGVGSALSEELQEYAYRRLLRKTAEAISAAQGGSAVAAFVLLAQRHVEKRRQNRQRPSVKAALQVLDDAALVNTEPARLLARMEQGQRTPHLYRTMADIAIAKWITLGAATRMELLINAFLPTALAIASGDARRDLLAWYWSQRAAQRYSALARRYPAIGQEYIWKQQGLIEYAALHKFGSDRVAESRLREHHLMEAERCTILSKTKIVLIVEQSGRI